MTQVADSDGGSLSRPLGLSKRRDLVERPVVYQGREWTVVKEPLGRRFVRLAPWEAAVLDLLEPSASLASLRDDWNRKFAPRRVTTREIQQFLVQLYEQGLVLSDAPGQARPLLVRRSKAIRKKIFQQLMSVLYLQLPGVDPERFLRRVAPWFYWVFSAPAFLAAAALGLVALGLLAIDYDVFARKLPTFQAFFGPSNWTWLFLSLTIVKILHELGHAVASYRYGARCREMGAMLLVFMPALYCDVSDAWLLRDKWKRMAISAAGIYVELVLASLATIVWYFSQPGLAQEIALSTMFVCSVGTVVFNGNPLLKFDGYYLLSDLVEIPNLQETGSETLRRWILEKGLGIEQPENRSLTPRWQLFAGGYSIVAAVYRILVIYSIFLFLRATFEPYGWESAAYFLSGLSLVMAVGLPLFQWLKFFAQPGRLHDVKRQHAWASGLVVAGALALVLWLPLPDYVRGPLETLPKDAAFVYCKAPGRLKALHVRPGETVQAGDAILELENVDLEIACGERSIELARVEAELRQLRSDRLRDPRQDRRLAETIERSVALKNELRQLAIQRAELIVRAPRSGTLFATPNWKSAGEKPTEELAERSGAIFDPANDGLPIEKGELICLIGDATLREAQVLVEQADVERVAAGQPATLLLYGRMDDWAESAVASVSPADADRISTRLTTAAGGDLAAVATEDGGSRPTLPAFEVRVPIDEASDAIGVGIRGRARILTGYASPGQRAMRFLSQTFFFAR